ncbi:CBS domain-containing protein [Rhizorhapis suberifaciens]|uniref:CBS domain-containing protein n=1 Tax=Rhizorhapis suberifaciens TaxID=13656 RepID=A0A840HRM7_9SPHN|nr:CBS domain-containing protein [Rhizorhapis suberifaciens]MBB4640543.1 CBS domain-containing protein [Rhizorhapis suberifaciens]
MKVMECMSRDVRTVDAEEPIQEAATAMADIDSGILPVSKDEKLVGMITDRDIAIRAIARGRGPSTPVQEIMSNEVRYCFEDEDVDDVLDNMADIQVRRLPVVNRDKRLVGIVSLSDLATSAGPAHTGEALGEIARPSTIHSQS